MNFSNGDNVHWTSQSSGYKKTKCGVIWRTVPAGVVPHDIKKPGSARKRDSYVVWVDGKLYWPKTEYLKPGSPLEKDNRTVATTIKDDLYDRGFVIVLKGSHSPPPAGYDDQIDKIIEDAIIKATEK